VGVVLHQTIISSGDENSSLLGFQFSFYYCLPTCFGRDFW